MDDDWVAREFGVLLERKRRDQHLTQETLSRRAGLSRTSIVNIEKGRQGVSLGTLYRLADALAIAPTELLPEQPATEAVSIAIGGEGDDAQLEVLTVLRGAGSDMRDK